MFILPMTACGLTGGPFEGKVYDEQTGKPIAGAYVVVTWTGERGLFVDSQSTCVHVEIAISDENGHFRIGRWINTENAGAFMDRHVSAIAYIADYRMADSYFPNQLAMVPFEGTSTERLRYIARLVDICGTKGNVDDINRFNRLVYAEARSLAGSEEDDEYINSMLYKVEIGEIGYKAATEKLLHRSQQDE